MSLGAIQFRDSIRWGGLYGLEAWTAYAIAECLFSSVLPWAVPFAQGYSVTNDAFTVFVTLAYMFCGALAGGLAGFFLALAARRIRPLGRLEAGPVLRAAATLSLVAALLLNFAYFSSATVPVVLAATWAAMVLASALSPSWAERLAALVNPWTTSFFLLGSEWLAREIMADWPPLSSAAVYASYLAAVALVAIGIGKAGKRSPATAAACALVAVIGAAFVLNQKVLTATVEATGPLPSGRPNVVLITMDTVRADHLSLYGYGRSTTPNLEDFAQHAAVYTEAISAGDMTLSTHASIFTGLYPSRHGAHPVADREFGVPLGDSVETLPVILTRQGYRTLAVVANFAYLAPNFGLARGFEHYDARAAVPFLAETRDFYLRERVRNYFTRRAAPEQFERQARPAGEINHAVFGILKKLRAGKRPFFLFVNYMDAHWPYLPPAPYDTLYPGKAKRFTGANYVSMEQDVMTLRRNVKDAERRHLVSQYDGAIRYLDAELGRLIARLKRLGLYDDTLIVITSDHGEAMGERHLLQHGVSVYQDEVHVPLLIKFPRSRAGIPEGSRIEDPVSSVDLLPTILDTLGYPVPRQVQGQSLLALTPNFSRTIFAESFPNEEMIGTFPRFDRIERAAFAGRMKLISSTAGKRELYDLSKDPDENRNIYLPASNSACKLESDLAEWIKNAPIRTTPPSKIDGGTLGRLKSLGYVQ